MQELLAIVAIVLPVGIIAAVWMTRNTREQRLRRKYQDQDGVVQRILTEEIWMGETKEQVADTFGTPVAVEEKINRKKAIEVWRYQPAQKNRFGMSITFEDGAVVAWERKR